MCPVLSERFWPKVDVRGAGQCWPWRAAKDGSGYGAIAAPRERRTLQAHRVSYEIAHGPIPDGLHVLHRCDNPRCVNPDHLFLGTHADNMEDKALKGRAFAVGGSGARRRSKLAPSDVRAILDTREPATRLAERLGVTGARVRQIRRAAA